jgi:DnaJ-class molecular chaperone
MELILQFQKLAFKWHPDRNDTPEAKEMFSKINASYRILSDVESRRAYDKWLDDINNGTSSAYGSQPSRHSTTANSSSWYRETQQDFTDHKAAEYEYQRSRMGGAADAAFNMRNKSKRNEEYNTAIHSMKYDTYDPTKRERQIQYERAKITRDFVAKDTMGFASMLLVFTFLVLSITKGGI